ncbi:MAG TPA: hypothetical protein PLV68_15285, partial [Ilumatobacteraceae bacterium]|nr:hypothetical protein [Ilumatobacteraceae bacterium]
MSYDDQYEDDFDDISDDTDAYSRISQVGDAETLVRRAAAGGAQVILLQELFATPYFCITEEPRHLA